MAIEILISGVDRTAMLRVSGYHQSAFLSQRATLTLSCVRRPAAWYSIKGLPDHSAYLPVVGQDVSVYQNGVKLFGGSIDQVEVRPVIANAEDLWLELLCVDHHQILDRLHVNAIYENQTVDQIVNDLLVRELPTGSGNTLNPGEGFSAGTIDTGPVVTKLIFDYKTASAALDDLLELTGDDGFEWFVDSERQLNFRIRSLNLAPFNLFDDTGSFLMGSLALVKTREKYANEVFLRFGRAALDPLVEKSEPGGVILPSPPDGVSQTFLVTKPVSQEPKVEVNGAENTVGLAPETANPGSNWYWSPGSQEIVQAALDPPLIAADVLTVTYHALFADVIGFVDDAEVAARAAVEGGSGKYQLLVERTEILDSATIIDIGQALLDRLKVMGSKLTFQTDKVGLRPGHLIKATIAALGLVDAPFLIDEMQVEDIQAQFLRFTCRAYGGEILGSYIEYFEDLIGGGRGGASIGGATGVGGEASARAHLPRAAVRVEAVATRGYSIVNRPGRPRAAQIACYLNAPIGADLIADWLYKNPGDPGFQTVFGATKLVNPAGINDAAQLQTTFINPLPFFEKSCLLRFDITQVGSTQAGGYVTSRLDYS